MKIALLFGSALLLLCLSCSKSKQEEPPPATTPPANPPPTGLTMLTDPVNCPPTLYQSNANAFQLSYARMKLIKGMSGQMTNITPNIIANNSVHVYMKSTDGRYYHLPATTVANILYNYSLTSAFPQCSFNIKRGTGVEEIFESIIVVGAKTSYLSSLNPQLDFSDYSKVKLKLGF